MRILYPLVNKYIAVVFVLHMLLKQKQNKVKLSPYKAV
jgi:hypothetical protein